MTLHVRIDNTEGLKRALTLDGDKILRGALMAGAAIVERQAKRDVHQVTGKLHDSTGTAMSGHGWSTAAHVGPRPGYGGPRKGRSGPKGRAMNPRGRVNRSDPRDYARRYNLGFNGVDSLGRRYNQRPNRYLVEALRENVARIGQAIKAQLDHLLREALR